MGSLIFKFFSFLPFLCNEKILNEQVECKIYDQNYKKIDLSVCNNIPIIVENKIINSSKLNIDKILELKNSGVDFLNIEDEFFNDMCMRCSDNGTNSDMILSDRVDDLFQNFSVCQMDVNINHLMKLNY